MAQPRTPAPASTGAPRRVIGSWRGRFGVAEASASVSFRPVMLVPLSARVSSHASLFSSLRLDNLASLPDGGGHDASGLHRQDHPHYLLAPKLAGSRLRFQLTPSRSDYPAGHGRRPSAVAPEDETFDDPAPLQHPDPPQGGVRAHRSGGGAGLCLRAYGLRLRPYRQRPAGDRVRRSVPPAPPGLRGGPRDLCAQHHRRRRQDQRPRNPRLSRLAVQRGDRKSHRSDGAAVSRGCRRARGLASHTRAARNRAHRQDAADDRAPRRPRRGLRGRGSRAVFALGDGRAARRATLRFARPPLARRNAGRRARRRRPLQARPDGLRAVEAVEAERARLAEPGRHRNARPPGLAHRVLGHVDGEAAWSRSAADCSATTPP